MELKDFKTIKLKLLVFFKKYKKFNKNINKKNLDLLTDWACKNILAGYNEPIKDRPKSNDNLSEKDICFFEELYIEILFKQIN